MADRSLGSTAAASAPMPKKEELDSMFTKLLSTMQLSAQERTQLLQLSDSRKWILIQKDNSRKVLLPPDFFSDQLLRHLDPVLRAKKVPKQKIVGLETSFDVLTKLEKMLRVSTSTWIEEFVDHPNNGHRLIMQFITDLPSLAHIKSTIPQLAHVPGEHHLCILCIQAIMAHEYGFRKILGEEDMMNLIVASILNENPATRLAALEMLAQAAADPHDGGIVAMDAIHYLSSISKEPARFITIMQQLRNPKTSLEYKKAGMKLMSNVVNYAPDLNMLVYWQMDLERAGVDEVISDFEQSTDAELRKMAQAYKAKLVNVDSIVSAREENLRLYTQSAEEITSLQMTVERLTRARDELRTQFKDTQLKTSDLEEMVSAYRKETARLNEKMEEASRIIIEQNTMLQEHRTQLESLEVEHDVLRAQVKSSGFPMSKGKLTEVDTLTRQQQSSESSSAPPPAPPPLPPTSPEGTDTTSKMAPPPPAPPLPPGAAVPAPPPAPPAPPAPPPLMAAPMAPPLMGGGMMTRPGLGPNRLHATVPLPMLNWVPLRKVTDTIFEEIDDERAMTEIDFSEFEKTFRAKETKEVNLKLVVNKKKEKVTVIESNRARNLVITCRRIGMDYDFLKETILGTDLTELQPEHAELLLNYIATEEEAAALDKHSHHKDRLDEAERFMWEMLKVERYESRLRVLAYIGYFDEILLQAKPQVDAVLRASRAILESEPFKKVLEIILAFGNYMNSHKRGLAYGFKLDTFDRLLDTRAPTDRRVTLLHWIVKTITEQYPQCEHFYETLPCLEEASRVSLVTLQTDVQGLRKGIDLVLYEREKQQTNFVIYSFYTNAVHKVAKLTEQFKELQQVYSKACIQFNENPTQMEPFEFFAVFDKFVHSYKKCMVENTKRAQAPQEPEKLVKVITKDEFAKKFSDLKVELAPHPVLGTTSKTVG